MIWQGMFGNGAIPRLDRPGTFGVAAGTTSLTACVVAASTVPTRSSVTTSSVSAPSAVKLSTSSPLLVTAGLRKTRMI